jgi:hypothetical protein
MTSLCSSTFAAGRDFTSLPKRYHIPETWLAVESCTGVRGQVVRSRSRLFTVGRERHVDERGEVAFLVFTNYATRRIARGSEANVKHRRM